jgi:hypothetical protein
MPPHIPLYRIRVLILNKYWECHEITEYLKIYSWSKHVKQINEFLMMMWNMWWHFRFFIRSDKFCFGQTVFLNCLTECQTSCLGFFDMSVQILIIVWTLQKTHLFVWHVYFKNKFLGIQLSRDILNICSKLKLLSWKT